MPKPAAWIADRIAACPTAIASCSDDACTVTSISATRSRRSADTAESLREQIAVVAQDTYLFYDTIADNLRLASPDATDEQLVDAAKDANAHAFNTTLPSGYDTMVGERGLTLSGGQRQRIAIARALLKNAPVLVLDEATSSVDAESERLITQALDRLATGRSTLVIEPLPWIRTPRSSRRPGRPWPSAGT